MNNVGKSSLAIACKALLEKKYETEFFSDVFYPTKGTSISDNITMLFEQLVKENKTVKQINIYDRTSFDNYAFLQMRVNKKRGNQHDLNIIQQLYPHIIEQLGKYDLIVFLKANEESLDTKTTYVDSDDRKKVNLFLENYYSNTNCVVPILVYEIDYNNFNAEIERIAKEIDQRVQNMIYTETKKV